MANNNPVTGRLAWRALRASGDVARLQQKLWRAILQAEVVMLRDGDNPLKLKAIHCLSQTGGAASSRLWRLARWRRGLRN